MQRYPIGATVTFAGLVDDVHSDKCGHPCKYSGVVNGKPEPTHDNPKHVPVFCSRSGGREPTTIYVAVENIISVEPPR